jgi:hypothetical protein
MPHRRKRKHRKRRIVQPALARALAERLTVGGQLFLQVRPPEHCIARAPRCLTAAPGHPQSDVKAVAEDMVTVFQSVAGDLLELAPVHFGPGASADWPPPEAARINQGDNIQRDAMRAAARRKARKLASAAGADAAGAASSVAAQGAGAAGAEGDGAGDEDAGGESDSSDGGDEVLTGWALLPGNGWLRDNPVGVPTERELGTNAAGGHCWRALLQRRAPDAAAPAPAA